jgi:hypothetical protein
MVLFAGICYENVIVAEATGTTDVDLTALVQLFGCHNYRKENIPSRYYEAFVPLIEFYSSVRSRLPRRGLYVIMMSRMSKFPPRHLLKAPAHQEHFRGPEIARDQWFVGQTESGLE